jgi:hypothetical protein
MFTAGSKPLGITLLGVNERDKARLEFFIDLHWSSNCRLVDEKDADMCILDLDSISGKKLLQQQRERHPNRPLIVLSVHDAHIDDVSLLRKPLSGDLLKNTIDELMTVLAQQFTTEDEALPITEEIILSSPAYQERWELNCTISQNTTNRRRNSLPDASTQARMIRGSCGSDKSIELDKPHQSGDLYYDPSTLFQQVLKNAIDQCREETRPLKLNLSDGKYIALLPEANIALTNLSDSKLRPRCFIPLRQLQVRTDYPDGSEAELFRNNKETFQDMDGLLWKVSLWSARGRLPHGTDIDATITLRQWPNLTRLLTIPQFLRIAALWVKTPSTLSKTTALLNIEARYVCAFFSACYALGLSQVMSMTGDEAITEPGLQSTAAPKSFLRRILQRLRVA